MLNVLEIILLDIKYLTINVVINQFDHIQMVNDQLMLTSIILFFFFFLFHVWMWTAQPLPQGGAI